jgi:hypothetical protein
MNTITESTLSEAPLLSGTTMDNYGRTRDNCFNRLPSVERTAELSLGFFCCVPFLSDLSREEAKCLSLTSYASSGVSLATSIAALIAGGKLAFPLFYPAYISALLCGMQGVNYQVEAEGRGQN